MATDRIPGPDTSVTQLVSGIIEDAQELTRQQLALFKSEVRQDFARTKEAMISLAAGVGVAVLGAFLLCFMLVYLLNWAAPAMPLWACFGIVGGLLAVVGAGLVAAGRKKFESFNPLPDQSVSALKENVQWIKNPK